MRDEEAHHPAGEGGVHRDEFAVGAPHPGHDVAGADVLALPRPTIAQCALAGRQNQPLVNPDALSEDVVKRLPPFERYWLAPEGLQDNAQFVTSSFHVKRPSSHRRQLVPPARGPGHPALRWPGGMPPPQRRCPPTSPA